MPIDIATGPDHGDELIRELTEHVWRNRLERKRGADEAWLDGRVADGLPDLSPAGYQERANEATGVLQEIAALRGRAHSVRGREDLDVLEYQSRVAVAEDELRDYEAPATSDSSPWGALIDGARSPIHTLEDADRYLSQLEEIPRYLDQVQENMRTGLARGFGPARVSMVGREAIVRTVAEDRPENPFRSVFRGLPDRLGRSAVEQRRTDAVRLVDDHVIPAFSKLLQFLETEYLPHLPEEISAATRYGEDYYRQQVYRHCAMEISAEEIHQRGLAAVEGILAEMRVYSRRVGFGEDLDALFSFMRTDPQFYARTPQELLNEAAWEAKMFDGVVHQYFGVVPRSRFRITEPAPDLAPFYTFGRGGIGQYILNTYPLDQRPLYSLPALTLHEAAPGHTFQIAHALENPDLPEFRKKSYISSYGEGWALYCERLGVEMGMYRTDFEMLGMLSFQMWRAVRLVIDPGVHALGWSRDKAIAYLRDHTAIGEHEVTTEVDRYISWPGQAPSYALGQAVIEDLRATAEKRLGDSFRLEDFHDEVLGRGCVPLATLQAGIEDWISSCEARVAEVSAS